MNEKFTAEPSSSPEVFKSTPAPAPATTVSPEASESPELSEDVRSLNPPSVSDAHLRRFAAIIDSVVPANEQRDYIIFGEYGNYSDVSLYLLDAGSTISANGTVTGTYTRFRIWSDYYGDNRYKVYEGQTGNLIFPVQGDVRSANVYSSVLGYSPNPYSVEYQHLQASAVSSSSLFFLFAFAAVLALFMGVLGKCLRK